MKKEGKTMENSGLLATILVLSIVSLVLTGYVMFNLPSEPQIVQVEKPVIVETPYNDTALKADVLAISNKVSEEDNWEVEAKSLALSEVKDDKYEDLFDYLVSQNVSIVDKEDISSVVVKDSDVTSSDVDEKNADVAYELKVYYEDAEGADKKVYVNADVVIEDNEVEDLIYSLA
jgi:hypothetical protein